MRGQRAATQREASAAEGTTTTPTGRKRGRPAKNAS